MRRRERWANLAWVTWVATDCGGRAITPPEATALEVGAALQDLTSSYKRYVELEMDGEAYLVRILPRGYGKGSQKLDVGLSYIGIHLGSILTCALVDLDMLEGGLLTYRVGANEVQRWVS